MLNLVKKDILEKARELNVRFVRLQFTDILGTLKNVAITVDQLEKALDEGIVFDGSSIEGFTRIQESDMYLYPDPSTFTIFPWRPSEGGTVARMICNVYTATGERFPGCPRNILQRVCDEAAEMGYTMYAGPEPEFFLFETDEKGQPVPVTQDRGGYFDLSPVDKGEDTRRDIVLTLEQMGFEVEQSHHEVAPGQHEIDFRFTDALTAADNIATFRFVTKAIARRHGLHATFMPKPIFGENGSGLHIHQSLFSKDVNVFYEPQGEMGLSETALHYIGGLLEHARAITAIANPVVNSYKRLVPGYEAPVYVTWSAHNRSSLVRIPIATGNSTRIELRSPDPACNPYLIMAVILKAGLDGIKRKLMPGEQLRENVYDLDPARAQKLGLRPLPVDLREALSCLSEDSVIRDALGDHAYEHYMQAKLIEWDVYRTQVHKWEIEQFLPTL